MGEPVRNQSHTGWCDLWDQGGAWACSHVCVEEMGTACAHGRDSTARALNQPPLQSSAGGALSRGVRSGSAKPGVTGADAVPLGWALLYSGDGGVSLSSILEHLG